MIAGATTLLQETSSRIAYSGTWSALSSRSDNGGASAYLNSAGSASLTFDGTEVTWISRTSATSGIADVILDGVKVATVDRYSASNAFQVPVFTSGQLTPGTHTLTIVRTGGKNPSSGGTNLLVDGLEFVGMPVAAPAADAASPVPAAPLRVTNVGGTGIELAWSVLSGTARAVINRSADGGAFVPATTLSAATTTFLDISVKPGSVYRYVVSMVDAGGKIIATSAPIIVTAKTVNELSPYRYSNCPTATTTVSTAAALTTALSKATPGAVIRMEPGTYTGQFKFSTSGTAAAPIWLCGPRTAIITNGSATTGHGIMVSAKHDIVVAGMTVRNNFKGLTVIDSQRITATDLLIENVGYEAVHFRNQTTDSVLKYSTVRNTGLVTAKYGEGVYIGTSETNWCKYNACLPDRTERILVYKNVFTSIAAQAIEAKPGTANGAIVGNQITGKATGDAWVLIKGNNWLVADNKGSGSSEFGYGTNGSVAGWGEDNIFTRNEAANTASYGIWIHKPNNVDLRNRVSCLMTNTATPSGATNVTCEG